MSFTSWLRNLRTALAPSRVDRTCRRRSLRDAGCRPRLEVLEDRTVPSFATTVSYPNGSGIAGVLAEDFNGDGKIDLVTANSDGIRFRAGTGTGTFGAAIDFSVGGYPQGPLAAADFNRDGRLDLAVGVLEVRGYDYLEYTVDYVEILLGNGDGSFTLGPQVLSTTNAQGISEGTIHALVAGDFNGDLSPDVAAAFSNASGGSGWGSALGSGDGNFDDVGAYSETDYVHGYGFLRASDFDGDGRTDLVLPRISSLDVLFGKADGTFQTVSYATSAAGMVVGDFNGDGHPDINAVNYSVAGAAVLLNDGFGGFGPPLASPFADTVGDFNADGRDDLITYEGAPDPRVYLSRGDGTFSAGLPVARGSARAVADFNGDGYADLAGRYFPPYGSGLGVQLNRADWSAPDAPSISISDVTVIEGNAGTRAATFTVTLSAAYSQPVTVAYATANGSAAAGSDYQASSGTLTIPAGQTTGTITVQVNGDRLGEMNETFFVNLSGATNANIADGEGQGAIVDDEPRISISDVTKSEGKKGQTTLFTFTVTLSAAYDQAVTLSYRTANGTAKTSNGDYVARTGTLTFAPGETSKTITIEVKGDSKREADEYFFLDLFGNSSHSLFTKNRGIGTILNDD